MTISTHDVMSITEANQNFSAVARKADARGQVVIFKNNRPAYVVYAFDEQPMVLTDEERLTIAEQRVLRKYRRAFEELAK